MKSNFHAVISAIAGTLVVGCVVPPGSYYDPVQPSNYANPSSSVSPSRFNQAPTSAPISSTPVQNFLTDDELPVESRRPNREVSTQRPPPARTPSQPELPSTVSPSIAAVSAPTTAAPTPSESIEQQPKVPPVSAVVPAPETTAPPPKVLAIFPTPKGEQGSPLSEAAEDHSEMVQFKKDVEQNPRTVVMKVWNEIVLNNLGAGGIALFSGPGEMNASVPSLFAAALGDMNREKQAVLRIAVADPNLLGWARDMGKLVISYMPVSPETAEANMKAFAEALPVLKKPLAPMPDEIEFDDWYTYSVTKRLPVPEFWANAYGKETWTPAAVYAYAFLRRREADQKDTALKSDTVKAWQELLRAWGDALGARIMSKTWVVDQPPSTAKTTPVVVRQVEE